MKPYATGDWGELYRGSCLEVLLRLPEASVHCCITSPPYWALRDYGTGTWEGGDPACDHHGSKPTRVAKSKVSSILTGSKEWVYRSHVSGEVCARCGARRLRSRGTYGTGKHPADNKGRKGLLH